MTKTMTTTKPQNPVELTVTEMQTAVGGLLPAVQTIREPARR